MKHPAILLGWVLLAAAARPCDAALVGQIDTFDSDTQNWQRGAHVPDGGPTGAGDGYLELTADGFSSSRAIVTFNQAQWSGDYTAEGVAAIRLSLNNLGDTPLDVRLVVGDGTRPNFGGSWYTTTAAVSLAPGSGWTDAVFSLDPSALTNTQGAAPVEDVLQNVVTLRILHSAAPAAQGDPIVATLGVDNIEALPIPEPTAAALALAALAAGLRNRRRAAA